MGIKRLYPNFQQIFEQIDLNQLRNKRIGIDGMGWLYSSIYNSGSLECEYQIGIIRNFMVKIKLLQKHKIQLVFVIGGKKLPIKKNTHNKRELSRLSNYKKS